MDTFYDDDQEVCTCKTAKRAAKYGIKHDHNSSDPDGNYWLPFSKANGIDEEQARAVVNLLDRAAKGKI